MPKEPPHHLEQRNRQSADIARTAARFFIQRAGLCRELQGNKPSRRMMPEELEVKRSPASSRADQLEQAPLARRMDPVERESSRIALISAFGKAVFPAQHGSKLFDDEPAGLTRRLGELLKKNSSAAHDAANAFELAADISEYAAAARP